MRSANSDATCRRSWDTPAGRDARAGLGGRQKLIERREPTAYGQWMFDHLDPMTHLGSFARAPAITFPLGGNDLHINAENAVRFKAALAGAYPDAATEVHIRVHPGLDHLGAGRDRGVEDACLDWLLR
ncbi:MAG: hypothetical protein WAN44_13105 [Propionibacteriaceae bacterium]